jgi:methylenetetrahydrofolate dehydrogenase (NADP+)/methenyltetrahydrofolate cyclohydrolase
MALLYGKQIASEMLTETAHFIHEQHLHPGLAVILIGNDAGSEIYVRLKSEAAERIGIRFSLYRFSKEDNPQVVRDLILRLNQERDVHGIILQLPLPAGWDPDEFITLINPRKDADGFHPEVIKEYVAGNSHLTPVLPGAIEALIISTGALLQGERAVVLVNSDLFGRVIQQSLSTLGLQVTIVKSLEVAEHRSLLSDARVVVSVCGRPGLVNLSDLRSDAIVVDAGITRVNDRVQGDISGDKEYYTGWVTPIPGGVGPLTIACLLRRVAEIAARE